MTHEQRELAGAFVKLSGWAYRIRMSVVWLDHNLSVHDLNGDAPYCMGRDISGAVPDLSDPLTVCAIELRCRELWGDTLMLTHAHFGCFAVYADGGGWTCNTELHQQDDPDWRARCLFDAMNAHTEAAQ